MLVVEIVRQPYEINPKDWFKNVVDERIIMGEFEKRMIWEVGRCRVIGPNLIISDYIGAIPPSDMGGGLLAVLAMKYADYKEDGRVDLSQVGEDMIPYIRKIASEKDIHVTASTYYPYVNVHSPVFVENTKRLCKTNLEFYDEIDNLI